MLKLNEDYYLENDKIVFTSEFLLQRGYCCNSKCRHCPYQDNPYQDKIKEEKEV